MFSTYTHDMFAYWRRNVLDIFCGTDTYFCAERKREQHHMKNEPDFKEKAKRCVIMAIHIFGVIDLTHWNFDSILNVHRVIFLWDWKISSYIDISLFFLFCFGLFSKKIMDDAIFYICLTKSFLYFCKHHTHSERETW